MILLNPKLPMPCSEDAAETEQAQNAAEEAKSLKQISFPEMDSDGLPSSFAMKVLGCTGKWQMKMHDLGAQLDPSNPTMKPFPGFGWSTKQYFWESFRFFFFQTNGPVPLQPVALLASPNLQPRLAMRASEFATKIGSVSDKISECNSEGIVDGFTHARLDSG